MNIQTIKKLVKMGVVVNYKNEGYQVIFDGKLEEFTITFENENCSCLTLCVDGVETLKGEEKDFFVNNLNQESLFLILKNFSNEELTEEIKEAVYLHFFNNYHTVHTMAKHFEVLEDYLEMVIDQGRIVNHSRGSK